MDADAGAPTATVTTTTVAIANERREMLGPQRLLVNLPKRRQATGECGDSSIPMHLGSSEGAVIELSSSLDRPHKVCTGSILGLNEPQHQSIGYERNVVVCPARSALHRCQDPAGGRGAGALQDARAM